MNIKATIKKIVSHAHKKEFQEIEKVCRKILKQYPRHYQALQYIGLALHNQKRYDEAIQYYKKALEINDKHSFVYNYLGCVYLDNRDYRNAKDNFKKAINLTPNHPEYIANLGLALYQLKKYPEAQKQYERAIQLKPDFAKAMVYLGVVLQNQGLLDESIKMHLAANDLDPTITIAYVHLFNSLSFAHVTDDALHVARTGLQYATEPTVERLELLIGIAKIGWLSGQIEMAKDAIFMTHSIPAANVIQYKNAPNLIAYHNYLSKLFTLRDNSPELYQQEAESAIFFVGDSHCLSPSETVVTFQKRKFRVLSTMITGCKAFHYSLQTNSAYKESMVRILQALPSDSIVIVGAGEIDCRPDEGIMTAHRQRGINYLDSVPKFVDQYVDFIVSVANKHNHHILFYGVASMSQETKEQLSENDVSLLCDIINLFNSSLRVSVGKRNLQLLDIYSLTSNIEEKSENNVHIDKFHVHPKTLQLLFDNFLIAP